MLNNDSLQKQLSFYNKIHEITSLGLIMDYELLLCMINNEG